MNVHISIKESWWAYGTAESMTYILNGSHICSNMGHVHISIMEITKSYYRVEFKRFPITSLNSITVVEFHDENNGIPLL